jgi:hypothetical protein
MIRRLWSEKLIGFIPGSILSARDFLKTLKNAMPERCSSLGQAQEKTAFFQQQGLGVMALDLSPERIKLCHAKGLKAQVMDYRKLEFEASFDAIYALNSLLHTPKTNSQMC